MDTRLFLEIDRRGIPFIYSRTLIGGKLFPARCSISLFGILALYISTSLRSAVCRNSVGEKFYPPKPTPFIFVLFLFQNVFDIHKYN